MATTNLGNVTGLIKSTTPPTKTYVLWGRIIDPAFPDVVEIRQYGGLGAVASPSSWLPLGQGGVTVNVQTGTAYTVTLSDNGGEISFESAAPVVVTFPDNLPLGFNCAIWQNGAGQLTFQTAGTAVLKQRSGFTKTLSNGSGVSIAVCKANVYNIQGDMQ